MELKFHYVLSILKVMQGKKMTLLYKYEVFWQNRNFLL